MSEDVLISVMITALAVGVGLLINKILSQLDSLNTKMDEILKDIRKEGEQE